MRIHPIILALATGFVAVPLASADPILITGGSVVVGSFASPARPPFGFQLTGENTLIGGITFDQGLSFVNAGQRVDLSTTVSLSSTFSSGPCCQTVRGVQFTDVLVRGTLDFDAAPFTVPADTSASFSMAGTISVFEIGPFLEPGALLLTAPITGRGTASIGLFGEGDPFGVTATVYSFSPAAANPVPEPGTLLLLGSGVAFAVGRMRRRKS